jgi:hypothetical protein
LTLGNSAAPVTSMSGVATVRETAEEAFTIGPRLIRSPREYAHWYVDRCRNQVISVEPNLRGAIPV